jgi:hypothetical protein
MCGEKSMFKFLLGFLSSALVCTVGYKYMLDQDYDIMLQQNDLLQIQQEIIIGIELDCIERNWLTFGDEIFICMHVNEMFQQLSEPPTSNFKNPDENQA